MTKKQLRFIVGKINQSHMNFPKSILAPLGLVAAVTVGCEGQCQKHDPKILLKCRAAVAECLDEPTTNDQEECLDKIENPYYDTGRIDCHTC